MPVARVGPTATVVELEAGAVINATTPIVWGTGDILEVDIVVAVGEVEAPPPVECELAAAGTTTATTTGTTGSWTPDADVVYVLVLNYGRTGGTNPVAMSSVTGNGITWTEVRGTAEAVPYDNSGTEQRRLAMWYGSTSSPTTGAVTFTNVASMGDVTWQIIGLPGADVSDPIRQSRWSANAGSATLNLEMTYLVHTNNHVMTVAGSYNTGDYWTAQPGFDEIDNQVGADRNTSVFCSNGQAGKRDISQPSTSAAEQGLVAIEIRRAANPDPTGASGVTFVGSAAARNTAPTMPTNSAGDLMFMMCSTVDVAPNDPSGWSIARSGSAWYKVSTGGESTPTLTGTTVNYAQAVMVFTGVNSSNPFVYGPTTSSAEYNADQPMLPAEAYADGSAVMQMITRSNHGNATGTTALEVDGDYTFAFAEVNSAGFDTHVQGAYAIQPVDKLVDTWDGAGTFDTAKSGSASASLVRFVAAMRPS